MGKPQHSKMSPISFLPALPPDTGISKSESYPTEDVLAVATAVPSPDPQEGPSEPTTNALKTHQPRTLSRDRNGAESSSTATSPLAIRHNFTVRLET